MRGLTLGAGSADPAPEQADTHEQSGSPIGLGVVAGFTCVVAVLLAALLSTGAGREAIILILGGAVFGGLALYRFEYFILALLVVRPTIELGLSASSQPASRSGSDLTSMVAVGFLVAFGLWVLIQRPGDGSQATTGPARIAIYALLASIALSTIGSSNPSESVEWLLRLTAAFLMFFAVNRLLRAGMEPLRVAAATLVSAVVPLAIVVGGYLTGNPRTEIKEDVERIVGPFLQSNPFAHYLLVVVVLALALLPYYRGWYRLGLATIVVLGTGSLVLTLVRSAWIGLAVALVLLGIIQTRAILAALLVGAVVAVVFVPSVSSRISELTAGDTENPRDLTSLEWRFGVWEESLDLAAENPVTGLGVGVSPLRTTSEKPPHNDYLRALTELGVIGLVAYVGFVVSMIVTGWRGIRRGTTGPLRGVAVGFFAYAVAFAVSSMAENLISLVSIMWYVVAWLAIADWIARRPEVIPSDNDDDASAAPTALAQ